MKYGSNQLYIKTPEEMHGLFGGSPRLAEYLAIAERCNLELEFGSPPPHFPLPGATPA
jgi:DNA polymerase III alpha subunit